MWGMTVGPTLTCVCEDVVGTLTVNNANDAQRMPDKDNFGCILVEVDNVYCSE